MNSTDQQEKTAENGCSIVKIHDAAIASPLHLL
jgi:hypothetical protein